MPGVKIRDEDREKIPAKYICTYCHHHLINPMQTMCGHLFCKSCMDIILGNPDPKCPEDKENLTKENVFPDAFTKRELKRIHLHCPSEECKWFGTYEELEGHSRVCEHALISCIHKQCNIQLPRSLFGEHLKNECEYRNVKCEYCGKDVPYSALKDHKENVCGNYPVICKYCNQIIPKKDTEHHEKTTCNEVLTKCEFQTIGCSYDKEIRQHMNDNLIDHVSALLRCVMAFVKQLSNYIPRPEFTTVVQNLGDRITAVRANLSDKFLMLVGKLTGLERRIERLESRYGSNNNNTQLSVDVSSMCERIATLERQARDNSFIIVQFYERFDHIDESFARVEDMADQVRAFCVNLFEKVEILEREVRANTSTIQWTSERLDEVDELRVQNPVMGAQNPAMGAQNEAREL
ncbi:TNF receptor-associated factor 5-like isoform X2 [Xenia sp. Carnegie-2017]|uniref:TNF receptor-associated factor 5-like isoform X2 n=1 Tax=Xenia sp. Carnegie-2017 TaxID=2897299 RepID=UPI001F04EC52|nr:TNF receptor-associated factor 5-like isoform X2 [Xenia sp. Carnegie-2017]